jgi:hypothetical protein
MRKILLWFAPLLLAGAAFAQAELRLALNRDFGFSWASQIQGKFTLRAEADLELAQVTFWIDDQILGEATGAPFAVGFHTGVYSVGWHTLSAEAVTTDGRTLISDTLRLEFVTAEAGGQFALKLLLPVLGLLGALVAAATVIPMVLGRGSFQLGQYGMAGGAVCPRCSLPFSRHALSLNLVTGKLERCPHCGRWSIVGRASPAALAEAEARWGSETGAARSESEADRLQRQIDESRYTDR